jgi:hypothetical protein
MPTPVDPFHTRKKGCACNSCYSDQFINWYLGSVRLLNDMIAEKDKRIEEKDDTIAAKQESLTWSRP